MALLLLALAVAPCLFILWYFYHKDKYEPEPKKQIWKIFILGAFMLIPAALIESVILAGMNKMTGGILLVFIESFFIVAPIEEISKYITVKLWIYHKQEFDEVMDGIIYTVSASLGFATLENIFYVTSLGFGVGVLRAFLSVPGHAFFGAVMGYYIGRAKFNKTKEKTLLAAGFLWASFFHGLYNFLLLTRTILALLVIVLLIVLWIFVRKNLKKAAADSELRLEQAQEINSTED